MRIIIYLISIFLILFGVSSCSKGELISDPLFGYLSFSNFAGSISVIEGADKKLGPDAKNVSMVSGENRFRFYNADELQLDTLLKINPLTNNQYFIFKPNSNSSFRVLDLSFNGFDKQVLPDSGMVKISVANFSAILPDKVNIYLTTTTYSSNVLEQIQVGEFLNTNGSFSAFQTIRFGKNQLSRPQNLFVLTIKDPKDNKLLNTIPLTLPAIPTGKLVSSVYVLYINADNNATILMSK